MGAWTQLHQTWLGHRAIIPTQEVFLKVRISCCFFKRSGSKLSDVENDAKLSTFRLPVKIREGGRDLYTNC